MRSRRAARRSAEQRALSRARYNAFQLTARIRRALPPEEQP